MGLVKQLRGPEDQGEQDGKGRSMRNDKIAWQTKRNKGIFGTVTMEEVMVERSVSEFLSPTCIPAFLPPSPSSSSLFPSSDAIC